LLIKSPDWWYPTFPDITVCNVCPLVHENEINLTYNEYAATLHKTFTYSEAQRIFGKYVNISKETFIGIFGDLVSPCGYFNNFPMVASQKYDSVCKDTSY